MIVWGGLPVVRGELREQAVAGGAAYDPNTGQWRLIEPGPLNGRAGAVASWTGSRMLLWGGYQGDRERHDGAVYDPVTDAWQAMAESPLGGGRGIAAAWTGQEWWVAVDNQYQIEAAAYDPASDSWRALPSVSQPARRVQMFWTGSEVLMLEDEGGLYSIAPDGTAWQREPIDLIGPATWTGELLVGNRIDEFGTDPLRTDTWWYPVAWDPDTNAEVELPKPAFDGVYGPLWTGDTLSFFEYRQTLDLSTGQYAKIQLDHEPPHIDRSGAAQVWADDRLIVWGGWSACPGPSEGYEIGYELIPPREMASLSRVVAYAGTRRNFTTLARSAASASPGAPQALFAC
jgi:hypothetical protein